MKLNLVTITLTLLCKSLDCTSIENRYIVKFSQLEKESFNSHLSKVEALFSSRGAHANSINHKLENSIFGFSGTLDPITYNILKNSPFVARISPVRMMKLYDEQRNATWGLARLSTREKLQTPPFTFKYRANGGQGVTAYVVDTGINTEHVEFEGRASWGVTIVKNAPSVDNNGHGTHCSGTIAGKTYGVAKKAKVVAVKVYDGNTGPDEDVLAGIEWVICNADLSKPNVMSLSLGTDYPDSQTSQDVVDAVNKAMDLGIVTTVAAGNDYHSDACKLSPARAEKVITVGSTTINDELSDFSNTGKCVNILAPGSRITSAWIGSPIAIRTISGTSMATPHVAGICAVLLSKGVKPQFIKDKLLDSALIGSISGVPQNTANLLAHYPTD